MRSGSTLLGEAMYFAGGLGCPLEYYHAGFRPSFEERWDVHEIGAYTAALHRWRTDESGTFAIKLFWRDVTDLIWEMAPDLWQSLPKGDAGQWTDNHYRAIWSTLVPLFPNPAFVRLRRDDDLGQAISSFIAGETRQFRRRSKRIDAARPDYEFETILRRLAVGQNEKRHWRRFLAANSLRSATVRYEDLCADYDRTAAGLLSEFGARSRSAPKPRLQKQSDETSERFRLRFLQDFRARARGSQAPP